MPTLDAGQSARAAGAEIATPAPISDIAARTIPSFRFIDRSCLQRVVSRPRAGFHAAPTTNVRHCRPFDNRLILPQIRSTAAPPQPKLSAVDLGPRGAVLGER